MFNENYNYLIKQELIAFFEVRDFVPLRNGHSATDDGWHHVAWAFLHLRSPVRNDALNVGQKIRLQLYKVPSTRRRHHDATSKCPDVFHW